MALTNTNVRDDKLVNTRVRFVNTDFDSSYPAGGEAITASDFGMDTIVDILISPRDGYSFHYDSTNSKLKVYAAAPAIVIEEKHTAVANLITLDYPAAWIINVCQAGQHMAWGKSQAAATLAANSFCVVGTIADGVRTQLYTDGATDTVFVTYVTQAWKELYALLVQEEAVTLATGANALANAIMAYGFVEAATTGILTPVDIADTTGSGEIGVKFGFAAGALDAHADENTQAAVVTYLKTAATGSFIADRYVSDEDPAKAGADPYTQAFDKEILVWCLGGYLTATTAATQVMIEQHATAAAGEFTPSWQKSYDLLATVGVAPAAATVFGTKSDVTATAGAYIHGRPWEIPTVPLEIKNGTDLSDLTDVRMMVVGY